MGSFNAFLTTISLPLYAAQTFVELIMRKEKKKSQKKIQKKILSIFSKRSLLLEFFFNFFYLKLIFFPIDFKFVLVTKQICQYAAINSFPYE